MSRSIQVVHEALLWDGNQIGIVEGGRILLTCSLEDLVNAGFERQEVAALYFDMPEVYSFLKRSNLSYYYDELPILAESEVPSREGLERLLEDYRTLYGMIYD